MTPSTAPPLFDDASVSDSDDERTVSRGSVKVGSPEDSDSNEEVARASKDASPVISGRSKKRAAVSPSPEWEEGNQSDASDTSDFRRRKRRNTGPKLDNAGHADVAQSIRDAGSFNLELTSAKYDLSAMEGGRITFLFEKISGSKL